MPATLEHIFPGHPITLAVDVMRRYPSYAAASARSAGTTEAPAALRNSAIPGAADNLRAALELIKFALDGHTELALEAADEFWRFAAEPYGLAAVERGSDIAKSDSEEFRQRLSSWAAGG